MNNFSPNMLKTFEQCEMKFFLKYIQKISMPQRANLFEKGKKIHALANYYLCGQNIERMEKALNADEKIAWEALKANKYFKLENINTEYNLSCKIGDFWVGGRLDALMRADAKREKIPSTSQLLNPSTFIILDYKTGLIPKNAQEDFQTIIYLLCVEKHLIAKKIPYNSIKFVYLGLKDNDEKTILLTDDLKKKYEEKISGTCKKICFAVESNVFAKKFNSCKTCELKKLCE